MYYCHGCGKCTYDQDVEYCNECWRDIEYSEMRLELDEDLGIADIVTDLLCEMGIRYS